MMRVLVGFALGYALGAKMTSGGYEELRRAWQTISESEEFRGAVESARAFVGDAVSQGSERLRELAAGGGDLGGALRGLADAGDLRTILRRISER
jgi:hypothetical protein